MTNAPEPAGEQHDEVTHKTAPLTAAREPSEFAFAGERLILKPVRHVIRSIYIQEFPKHRTFHAIWNAQILCWPEEFYELGGVVDVPHGWPMDGLKDPLF